MVGIDKAAIGFSIGIAVAGALFAMWGAQQDAGINLAPTFSSGTTQPETATQVDPFAEAAEKAKAQQAEKDMEEQKMMEKQPSAAPVLTPKVEAPPKAVVPKTVEVTIPEGTAVPGCEETNACYIPDSVSINIGDTVTWIDEDTAAHTVTSGTPSGGPDGKFDSSLVMAGNSFSHTFGESGSFDYFCMVHPWMAGNVQVE